MFKTDITRAIELTKEKLKQFNLLDWSVALDGAKRRCGLCDFKHKHISLSRHYVENNKEENVMDTILHEIAHALVGVDASHSIIWKRKAVEIGCTACVSSKDAIAAPANYKYCCPKCNTEISSFRLHRKKHACRKCCEQYNFGKFSHDYIFKLKI